VIIYPSRSTEQTKLRPYQDLLNSERVNRIYLNELGNIRDLPIWVALMVLTTLEESQAPDEARYLLRRTSTESSLSRAIIELVTTIMVYKFENLSQKEVEVMLGITLQETRVYREIKAEWMVKGREQEAASLILRQLTKRFGVVSVAMRSRISGLPLVVLEDLSEAILDFGSLDDLPVWLAEYERR